MNPGSRSSQKHKSLTYESYEGIQTTPEDFTLNAKSLQAGPT